MKVGIKKKMNLAPACKALIQEINVLYWRASLSGLSQRRDNETLILSQLLLTASLQRLLQIFTIHYRSQKNKFSLISRKNRHSKQFPDSTAANSPIHVQEPVKTTVIPSSIHVFPYRGRDGLQLKDKSNYSGHLVSLRLPLITVKSNYRQHHVFLTKKIL